MPNAFIGQSVFDAALDRLLGLYRDGHRVVISFSGGKDSGVCLELALIAAEATDRLPVEAVMRDEEVMIPGTYEYAARVARQENVDFRWFIAHNPNVNIFNREIPYFWTFDERLDPSEWVRPWPELAVEIPEKRYFGMVTKERFPPPEGKDLVSVLGLRATESMGRRMGIYSSKGFLTNENAVGTRYARPIYDWSDGDVWLAHKMYGWDYNEAYDTMRRNGVSRNNLRVAPPTMSVASLECLQAAAKAHPTWFERVQRRLPGIATAVRFGAVAVEPQRRLNESWEQAYNRLCIKDAPDWIADRAQRYKMIALEYHFKHTTDPLPEVRRCSGGRCQIIGGSWKRMADIMYNGDPFSAKQQEIKHVEPSVFRPDAGELGGPPGF
jgi:predicted phosphoadenosine phosphosulfate sulfurtransferase